MNNEVFNLNDALSINELEERQELSIAAGFEVDDKTGTTTVSRCNNNDIGLNTPDGSGNGESNRFYFEP
jgi:hypothetical protein